VYNVRSGGKGGTEASGWIDGLEKWGERGGNGVVPTSTILTALKRGTEGWPGLTQVTVVRWVGRGGGRHRPGTTDHQEGRGGVGKRSIMLMMEGGEGRPSVAGSRGLGRKHGPGEWKWAREGKGKICSDKKGEGATDPP